MMLNCNCKLPDLPEKFLEIILIDNEDVDLDENHLCLLPFADSEAYSKTSILSAKKLTYGEDVKEVYLMELPSYGRSYEPGDTIGILPHNSKEDLKWLFKQLKISDLVNKKCKIFQHNKNIKLKSIPVFVDKTTSIKEIFRKCIDIRCIPKKSLIRLMAEHTKNFHEKTYLEELCSAEGAKKYEEEILNANVTFIDFLKNFPSCCPPVTRLLENLPPLLPRSYSIASSPLASPDKLKIIFSVASKEVNGLLVYGICTGMLKSFITQKDEHNRDKKLCIYFKKSNGFKLPKDNIYPLIFIGSGTGIAPFLGFLEHRKLQKSKGTIWLFYGCRYKSKDYLCKKELTNFLNDGVLTKLIVSHSRESGANEKYVQDNIIKHGKQVSDLILNKKALIYVCGNAKGMRKDILNAFVSILQTYQELDTEEANNYMRNLQRERRYLQDVWL